MGLMSRGPAGKIRFFIGQPVNAPFVTPPISLRAALIFCALSVTGTLGYAVAHRLDPGASFSAEHAIFVVLVFFLLPTMIAWSIAVNRGVSRPLIVLFSLGLAWHGLASLEDVPEQLRLSVVLLGIAMLLLIAVWLFGSLKMRVYYALITGRALPRDLNRPVEEIMAPGPAERRFRRVAEIIAPYAEIVVVALVIAGLVLAVRSMSAGP